MPKSFIRPTCMKVAAELKQTKKDLFSTEDVISALYAARVDSRSSIARYTSPDGYLIELGFLERVPGGWALTTRSQHDGQIVVDVMGGQALTEVYNLITDVMKNYDGIASVSPLETESTSKKMSYMAHDG